MPEMKKIWQWAYDLGIRMAKEYSDERQALYAVDIDDLDRFEVAGVNEFFHAGFIGREPEWVEAFRYGEIPEEGRSINWAENKWEPGVSCVKIIRSSEDAETDSLYGMMGREKIKVAGWYIGGSGSDGEPTLWGCVKLCTMPR